MTPIEINEAVARKLGYPMCKTPCKWPHCVEGDDKVYCEIKNYCGDIRAAWEIVEHLSGKDSVVTIGVYKMKYLVLVGFEPTSADTAPMAICLAFLKLEEIKLDRKG